jgi:hypothetical protein
MEGNNTTNGDKKMTAEQKKDLRDVTRKANADVVISLIETAANMFNAGCSYESARSYLLDVVDTYTLTLGYSDVWKMLDIAKNGGRGKRRDYLSP